MDSSLPIFFSSFVLSFSQQLKSYFNEYYTSQVFEKITQALPKPPISTTLRVNTREVRVQEAIEIANECLEIENKERREKGLSEWVSLSLFKKK